MITFVVVYSIVTHFMLKKTICLFVFFFATTFIGRSQRIINYSPTQGLSQGSVFDIYQDKKGFMWFTTADGLNRFDGYSFKVYRNTAGNPTMSKILAGRDNCLWIGAWTGEILRFSCFTEKLEVVFKSHNSNNESTGNPLFEDANNGLWIASDTSGVFRIDKRDFKITDHISSNSQYLSNPVLTDSDTKIWGSNILHELVSVDTKTKKITNYFAAAGKNYNLSSYKIIYILYDKQILWLGTDKGLMRFNPLTGANKQFIIPSLKKVSLVRSLFTSGDSIWIGTMESEIFIFNKKTEKISSYKESNYSFSSDKIITKFFKDRSDNLWIGSDPYGASKLDLKPIKFKYATLNGKGGNGTNRNFIKAFFVDDKDKMYVGTYGAGLRVIDRKTGDTHFFLNSKNDPTSIPGNIIYSINEDQRGKLWIVTDFGITLFDPTTNKFSPSEELVYKNSALGYIPLKILSNGIIVIAGDNEFTNFFEVSYLIPKQQGGYTKVVIPQIQTSVQCFQETKRYGVLIAAVNELYSLSIDTLHPEKFKLKKIFESSGLIKSIYEDKKGILWLATKTGLIKLEPDNNISETFKEKDGLPNTFLYGILADEEDNLWISSNKGISKFNMVNKTFKNYDVSDGLQGNEFNTDAYYKSQAGEMFFGGTNGYNYFYPKDVKDNLFAPTPVITAFKVFDLDYKSDTAIEYKTSISLKYNQNTISFEYSGLEFTNPEKNQFQYQLAGEDKNWVPAGIKRFARYTDLAPGNYLFKVRASNNDGVWCKDAAIIKIIIYPPYWGTWWFRGLIFLLIVLLFTSAIKLYVSQKLVKEKRELRAEKKIQEERNRISRDLHDNIGSEFVHILSQLDYTSVIAAKSESTVIKSNIDSISDNARDLMQMLKETIWAIEKDNLTFKDFVFKIKDLLIRYQSSFSEIHFSFHFNEIYDNVKLKPLQLLNLFRIIQEGISNAIKHAEATSIDIFLEHNTDKKLIIIIKDNGKGLIEKEFDDSHHGLRNMHDRANEIGSKLSIEGIYNKGTKVQIDVNLS